MAVQSSVVYGATKLSQASQTAEQLNNITSSTVLDKQNNSVMRFQEALRTQLTWFSGMRSISTASINAVKKNNDNIQF